MRRRHPQAESCELRLPEGTIGFEAIAESTAADDLEAFAAQPILRLAAQRRFEDDDAVLAGGADPRQLGAPVRRRLDHARIDAVRGRVPDVHAHFVTGANEAVVHRAQIAFLANAEQPHARAPG